MGGATLGARATGDAMNFSAAALSAVLAARLPPAATALVVAVSGGIDSGALLTALALVVEARALPRDVTLRAVHVNHGLQPAAAQFAQACAALCARHAIPFEVLAVRVDTGDGVSLEAAARSARYAALERNLRRGECLLTAHHAADQAETVLLQLLRGAGPKGLSAMPSCRAFGVGWHLRPLLEVAKSELAAFAAAHQVAALHDPMNLDARFDRVYLRTRVWPSLEARWPGAATAMARSARHAADAQGLLDDAAGVALEKLRDGAAVSLSGLRALPAAQRLNVLRHWIGLQAATLPSTARLIEALRQMHDAGAQQLPAVVWGAHALRRYRERLFVTAALPPRIEESRAWPLESASALDLGAELGTLRWCERQGGLDLARLPQDFSVRRRRGGETLKPQRRAKTQSLQHLCQARGVLPWMRDALPLLYAGDTLVAVGDLWMDARWCVAATTMGRGCVWEHAPIIV